MTSTLRDSAASLLPRLRKELEALEQASPTPDEFSPVVARIIELSEEFAQEFWEMQQQIRDKWLEVALAGPQVVVDKATQIEEASRELTVLLRLRFVFDDPDPERAASHEEAAAYLLRAVVELNAERAKEVAEKVVSGVAEFISLAQLALDDDGSKRRLWLGRL
ncbi:hypothetical protein [Streptomyces sp. UG1]|uniref:hypothetical protein n=1 Tax=Streptomyces sp. UG1 TaxID=3417652 RepID=UPI003CF41CA9